MCRMKRRKRSQYSDEKGLKGRKGPKGRSGELDQQSLCVSIKPNADKVVSGMLVRTPGSLKQMVSSVDLSTSSKLGGSIDLRKRFSCSIALARNWSFSASSWAFFGIELRRESRSLAERRFHKPCSSFTIS